MMIAPIILLYIETRLLLRPHLPKHSPKIRWSCTTSLTLNVENRFVVDLIPFSNLLSILVSFLGVFIVKNRMSAWEEQNELEVLSGSFWISEDGDKLFEFAILLEKNGRRVGI